ncbi:MAG: hypothetical protein GF365_01520 [Candidatus Buchananbacteria bacterium]|nr:hypothetical protein [Candidatus Buchananbacteria bacterium]
MSSELGIYKLKAKMPFTPQEFKIPKYHLSQTLGSAEQEEVAARLIVACQQEGIWCGISIPFLFDQIREDCENYAKNNQDRMNIQARNRKLQMVYERKKSNYKFLCFCTLGLYSLFVQKPVPPNYLAVPEFRGPSSLVYFWGTDKITQGINALGKRGFIEIKRTKEHIDVIFPTKSLLNAVAKYSIK